MKNVLILLLLFISCGIYAQDSVFVFQKKAPLPATPRSETASFVIDSDFYFCGGLDSSGPVDREVWKYHMPTNTWSPVASLPHPYFSGSGFALNGKGYMCSGVDSLTLCAQVWQYAPLANSWTRKNDYPGLATDLPACFTYNNKAYVGWGESWNFNNHLWRYNDTTDTWTEMDSLGGDFRYGVYPVVIDSFAYYVGGYYQGFHSSNTVYRYRILANKWDTVAPLPGLSRGLSATWSIGNNIITGYGIHLDSFSQSYTMLTDAYIYSVTSNTWRPVYFHNFMDSAADGSSFMIGSTLFYFAGLSSWNQADGAIMTTDLWSYAASSLLINGLDKQPPMKSEVFLYPNPISKERSLFISSPEEGDITFYNTIGQLLYTVQLTSGTNHLNMDQLHTSEGIIFYTVQLHNGGTITGKLSVIK